LFPVINRVQLKLDFEPGITDQFKTLKQCVSAVVYGSKIGLDGCAAACDLSPSMLTRMLNVQKNKENKRNLPLDVLVPIIKATGDVRPILWLCATFMPNDEQRKDAALARVEAMLPDFLAAVSLLKGSKK
jgi:hypothetical protein